MDDDELFTENGSDGRTTDEEEEDEDDDIEEEEPKIKFERIGNDLTNILDKDAVSCVAVHSKFVCVGSHRGQIYVLDPSGNNINLDPLANQVTFDELGNKIQTPLKKSIAAHKIAVNQMSIDYNGDFIGSCSDDGNINIFSLCDGQNVLNLNLDRKIRSIAIDPQYSRGGLSRRFIIGDDNVTLYERNIFSRLKPTVLLEGNTYSVSDIKWSDRFIAWSWNSEVRIYDMIDMITLSRVPFDNLLVQRNNSERKDEVIVDSHRCNLFWKDTYSIFIGWGNTVQLCTVKRQTDTVKIDNGASTYFVQIVSMFTTDFWICGISSFGQYLTTLCLDRIDNDDIFLGQTNSASDNNILSISNSMSNSTTSSDTAKKLQGKRPKLHLIKADRLNYEVVYTHVLQTRGFQEYKPIDYHFASLTDELLYFIATPKDIILAKSRDMDDHIEWLMSHKKYEEALECTTQNLKLLERNSILKVGTAFLDHLMETKRFDEAGKLCLHILGKENWMKWEEQVLKFAQLGQLRAIAPYLPRNENNRLNSYVYEMVLFDYLKNDQEAFLCLVRDWAPPPELYNVNAIINAVIDHLLVCDPGNRFLLQSLADLYSYERKYGKALAMYLKLQDPQVFNLIQRYGLFEEIKQHVEDLMGLNINESLILLMKHRDRIEPSLIVQKLQNNRYYLYLYLDALYKAEGKEMKPEFHGLIVSLYADYGPDKLLQFLQSSDNYPMQEAMRICTLRKMYAEMIFLLGRMGNSREALRLITHELEDIVQAIDFCKEHDDRDLWTDLINFSMDKPNYINELLCNIGTHVDPQILVRKIENGMEIPGLRDSLVKIMQDYNLQVALQEGCKNILVGDCSVLYEKLVKTQIHGVFVEDYQECGTCHKRIIVKDYTTADNIKVFFCKHVFHDSCLSTFDHQNCIICNLPRKGICLLEKL